ncbi:MAG: ABC transporter permease, partial [Mesorhizobium sp.]
IYVFASIGRGVTPEINAIATIVLVASVLLVVLAQWQLRQRKPSN